MRIQVCTLTLAKVLKVNSSAGIKLQGEEIKSALFLPVK